MPNADPPVVTGLTGPQKSGAVRLVMLACLIDYAGVGMIRTLMPYYVLRLVPGSGWSNASLLGSLETAYGAGQMLGAVVMGRLSDLQGRRMVLLLSFTGAACGYSLTAVATTPALLLVSRVPVGLAKQTVTVSRAIIADCCDAGRERSASFAKMIAAIGVGYSIGPLAGSWLADATHDTVPAFVAATLFVLLGVLVFVALPETSPIGTIGKQLQQVDLSFPDKTPDQEDAERVPGARTRGKPCDILAGWRALFKSRGLIRVVGATLLPEIALVMHSTTVLATLVVHTLQKDKSYMGSLQAAMAGCASLVGGFFIPQLLKITAPDSPQGDVDGGRLSWRQRLPPDARLLIAADILYGLCTLSLAVWPSSTTVVAGALPMGAAIAVLRSSPASWASQQVDADNQGAAMGFLGAYSTSLYVSSLCASEREFVPRFKSGPDRIADLASSMCRVLAPITAGTLIDKVGLWAAFALESVLCFVGAILVIWCGVAASTSKPKHQ